MPWTDTGLSLIGYLPAALLATLSVSLLPALLAATLISGHGVLGALATVAGAIAISLLLAAAESRAWKQLRGASGIVFYELMLWSFARRLWAERRLRQISAAYGAAADCGGDARVELLEGLSRLLETRNPYTFGHCRRVARHAETIARAMRLGRADIAEIRAAALIHDVGKVYTPVRILQKPGPLTEQEFAVVRRHCVDGAEMLAPVRDRRLAAIVRHHHERLDGSGYPDRLRGAEIPLGARIVAVADTFDAITSHRPYRRARSQRDALAVLAAESGEKLDAAAVAAFLDIYTPRRAIASAAVSTAIWSRLAPARLLPGGLIGGATLPGIVPALGAAGLLAVIPAARYERAPRVSPPGARVADLRLAFSGALPGARTVPGPGRSRPVAAPRDRRVRPPGARSRSVPASPPISASGGPARAGADVASSGAPARSAVEGAAAGLRVEGVRPPLHSPAAPATLTLTAPAVSPPAVRSTAPSVAPTVLPSLPTGGGAATATPRTPVTGAGPAGGVALPGATAAPIKAEAP